MNSPLTPSAGDADSTVRLTEFYNDHCGPCKANHPEFGIGGALLRGGTTADELKAELGRQRARRDSVQGASTNG